MKILSDAEREAMLKALVNAPDEVLIDAVRQVKDSHSNIKNTFKEIQGFIGLRVIEAPAGRYAAEKPTEKPVETPEAGEPEKKVNKKPPGVASSRIGGETKEKIMARLMRPSTAEDVNTFLGRGAGKLADTQSLLKRLWDLGEITFDGTTYRRAA
jgi:hypothetical protein